MSALDRNPLSAGLLVAAAALACGATAASLAWVVMNALEAGAHRTALLPGILLEALTAAGPIGAVFAVPGALVAPFLVLRTRLGPTIPRTFAAAVAATGLTALVTGTYGMFLLSPVVGYAVGFLVLVHCRHAYPLVRVSGAASAADRLSRRSPA